MEPIDGCTEEVNRIKLRSKNLQLGQTIRILKIEKHLAVGEKMTSGWKPPHLTSIFSLQTSVFSQRTSVLSLPHGTMPTA